MPGEPDLLPRDIQRRLETQAFARRIYYLPAVDSTNRLAVEFAKAGEAHGTLVIGDYQTEGRGRLGRKWESPAGRNLLFSVILRPRGAAHTVLPMTLAFSMAVADTLGSIIGRDAGVKWPNDIVVEDKKISGILSEGSTRGSRAIFIVVGIGINVNVRLDEFSSDLRERCCSCYTLTGREWNRRDVLGRVLDALERSYDGFLRDGFGVMVGRYKTMMTLLGKMVRFERSGIQTAGVVVDVAADGGLVVETGDGTSTLYDREVGLIRVEGGDDTRR